VKPRTLILWLALLLGANLLLSWSLWQRGTELKLMPVLVPEFAPAGLDNDAAREWPELLAALQQQDAGLQLTPAQQRQLSPRISQARLARERVVRHKNAIHALNTTIITASGRVLQALNSRQRDYVVNNRDAIQWQVNEAPLWRSWETRGRP